MSLVVVLPRRLFLLSLVVILRRQLPLVSLKQMLFIMSVLLGSGPLRD